MKFGRIGPIGGRDTGGERGKGRIWEFKEDGLLAGEIGESPATMLVPFTIKRGFKRESQEKRGEGWECKVRYTVDTG